MSYCEWPEFYNEDRRKARKSHPCVECNAPIEPGEEHLYYRGKWDGDFSDGRQHILCLDVCVELNRPGREKYGECEIPFGGLWEYWSGCSWSETKWVKKYGGDNLPKIREMRGKIARIKWRQRKFRMFSKLKIMDGKKYRRHWGQPWQAFNVC